ncbi:MAG: hypothetical protein WD040_01485 [Anaerolineales bacterium]
MTRARRIQVSPSGASGAILPLTERILAVFPGPRWFWTAVWALSAIPQIFFSLSLFEITNALGRTPPTILELAVDVNAIFLSVWGSRKLAAELQRTEPLISRLTGKRGSSTDRPIRGLDSIRGPLLLTAAVAALNAVLLTLEYGWRVALVMFPTDFLFELPLLAFFWTYSSLLIGLNRLGREKLRLDSTPGDRTLGLRPVGSLAFTGFWIFSLGFAPILIVSATSIPTLVLNLAFFLIGFALFVLSLSRLHRQMVEAKQRHLELARNLYAEAYRPLASAPRVRTLKAVSPLLGAAEALEKRVVGIQEWPFDEVLTGRIAIIVTSVVATVIARIILDTLGL